MKREGPLDAESVGRVEELCKRYKVRCLELFGSAARNEAGGLGGDLDFMVEFQDLGPGEYADCYFGLLFELQQIFLRPVDLLVGSAVENRYFLQAIKFDRKVLYAA